MDYKRVYAEFIKDRREKEVHLEGYSERHHIVPRALGGGDEPENLIRLTAADHLFAHLLLAKIHGGKMWYAMIFMFRPAKQLVGVSRGKRLRHIAAFIRREQIRIQTGKLRPDVSVALRGKPKSEAHRRNISKARMGWRDSYETRAKKSEALRNRVHSPERNAKLSAALKGRERSPEHSAKIAAKAKGRYIGSANPRYDGTIRSFQHEDGRIERATKFELAQKYGLNRTCLNFVINGNRRQTKGWGLYVGEIE